MTVGYDIPEGCLEEAKDNTCSAALAKSKGEASTRMPRGQAVSWVGVRLPRGDLHSGSRTKIHRVSEYGRGRGRRSSALEEEIGKCVRSQTG